jgi:hypothetical protein
MKTRSLLPNSAARIFVGACLLSAGLAGAAPPRGAGKPGARALDSQLRAAYPMGPSSTALWAGVPLGRLQLPGMQLVGRSEDRPEDGGIVLSFARNGEVRAILHLAVCADAVTARKVLDVELHGVSTSLVRAPEGLGDAAFSDDGQGSSLVLATQGNIFYKVDVIDARAGLPTAAAIAATLRGAMVPGAPRFPTATITLPPSVRVGNSGSGADIRVATANTNTYKFRADGAYIARGANGPVIRAGSRGPITIHAIVVDELGRVAITSANTRAE